MSHPTLLILHREFLERARSRSYWAATVLVPLLLLAFGLIQARAGGGQIVTLGMPAGDFMAAEMKNVLSDSANTWLSNGYRVRLLAGGAADEASLDAVLTVAPDALDSGRAVYRARNGTSPSVRRDVEFAFTYALQKMRLEEAGLSPGDIAALRQRVQVEFVGLDGRADTANRGLSIVAHGVAIATTFLIVFYCTNVLRSVLDEKVSRIAEILLSSTSAASIVSGKILGVSLAALLQVGLWIAAPLLLAKLGLGGAAIPDDVVAALAASGTDLSTVLWLLFYLLFGFLLYASLYAALGALVTAEHEAQSWQFVILAPCLMSIFALMRVANDPHGAYATLLGLVPLTAPFIMPVRIVAGEVSATALWLSLPLLIAATCFVAAMAARLYQRGILNTGRRASLRQVTRWLWNAS